MCFSNLLNDKEIQNLFERSIEDSLARENLLERFGSLRLPKPPNVSGRVYQSFHDDVRQQFLERIWKNRVNWDPKKGRLSTLIFAILPNLWIDVQRAEKSKVNYKPLEELSTVSIGAFGDFPELKPKYREQLANTKPIVRVVVKMWKPYMFARNNQNLFSPADESLLKGKCPHNGLELSQILWEEIFRQIEQRRDHIPYSFIAGLLNRKESSIGQTIHRAKKEMPWLGDLRNAVE